MDQQSINESKIQLNGRMLQLIDMLEKGDNHLIMFLGLFQENYMKQYDKENDPYYEKPQTMSPLFNYRIMYNNCKRTLKQYFPEKVELIESLISMLEGFDYRTLARIETPENIKDIFWDEEE